MPDFPPPQDITALILAGGMGSRMGGLDKGLQPYRGQPLVAHVLARMAPQVSGVLISANRNTEAYATYGYPVVADIHLGYAGPLAGIHAGLAACPTSLLATAPCDAPHLPLDLVARLHTRLLAAGAEIAVAATSAGLEPTFALMQRRLLPSLAAFLDNDRHRLQEWCRSRQLVVVDFEDVQAFANLNTLAELAGSAPLSPEPTST
jgi:molybdopterin-guanine dinucleotide biosynthesis protein A